MMWLIPNKCLWSLLICESILLGLILALPNNLMAQMPSMKSVCEERSASIVRDVYAGDLRLAVDHGLTGDGIRRSWMGTMHDYGIRRADIEVDFSIGTTRELLQLANVTYYRTYAPVSSERISDHDQLERVKQSGLPREMENIVSEEVGNSLKAAMVHQKLASVYGHVSYVLFDDECLPRLMGVPTFADPGETPLMAAAERNDIVMLKTLVADKAEVNARDQHGATALLYAAARSDASDAIGILLAGGADINVQDDEGQTALMWSAFEDDDKSVTRLIACHAGVNLRTKSGKTALHYAVSKSDSAAYSQSTNRPSAHAVVEIVRTLVDAGANVDFHDDQGVTPLIQAVWSGLPDAVRELVKRGANIAWRDEHGQTALAYALQTRLMPRSVDPEIANILQTHSSN